MTADLAAKPEARVSLAEMLALKLIPDIHAMPLKLYVGDMGERPLSEWKSLYREFMSKPTGITREQWHPMFIKKER
jgi:hypothetical protein